MLNLRRVKFISRLAMVAALGATAIGAQAQTSNSQCTALRDKLDTNLSTLRDTQRDLQRLRAIIRVYEDQRYSSILPASAMVARYDNAEEKAREHEQTIEQLTKVAGVVRNEIKRCEGSA